MAIGQAAAETIRIATYNTELDRGGPGLLLRDILSGDDPQVVAVSQVISRISPDILVLQRVDYDLGLKAVSALRDAIAEQGAEYPYIFALRPNTGLYTGLDMDGDGRVGEARDAQGYGEFAGQSGMAVLSRLPIDQTQVQDFSEMLWRDLPGAILPHHNGQPFPSDEALAIQRLSTVGHWVVPVALENTVLDLMIFHASPPVFDGPEDRNGKRNYDEIKFWQLFLDGSLGPPPDGAFTLIGVANLDPMDSDGRKEAIRALLEDDRLQDPQPMRNGKVVQDPAHIGDPQLDTADWPEPGPGALRVDYILPSSDLVVTDAGVYWPTEGTADADLMHNASRHRLVWVDLDFGD
ncbi:endonuclease/exonuclease/phosphatase family protein [uncultured Roseovarius sp.]|uniref:endonuclease/exonuclease/phosphatase family protein n=1 Tax=uncultured Roseovarius sp. TaxID=293344 RepID=UPI002604D060|nr:endonuclease/exonuclease/phosphatase family protein [uncultured Roseovarius sp.]